MRRAPMPRGSSRLCVALLLLQACARASSQTPAVDAQSGSTDAPSSTAGATGTAGATSTTDASGTAGTTGTADASGRAGATGTAGASGRAGASGTADASATADARATADASETSDARGTTLTLLDYNVQSRPVLDSSRAAINLPIIGKLLGEFGVADVEECFSQCDKLLAAAPQPNHYYFDQKQSVFSLTNSGLAGLTWYPIGEVVTKHYDAKAELADDVASKGVALMRLRVGDFDLDVYNTHMQAGDSDGAHAAQSAQADELVAFVTAQSPASHSVVLHGDFNMSPARPGKRFEDFAPNHYSNEADMRARTASFQKVIDGLHLADVSDVLFGPVRDHIDRVLYRAGTGVTVRPLSWQDRSATFVDASGAPLSDSMPLVVQLALEKP